LFSTHLQTYEQQIGSIFPALSESSEKAEAPGAPVGKMPKASYFLCFINRSGSNLLAEALTKTRRMGKPGEIFNPEPIGKIASQYDLQSMSDYIDWQLANNAVGGIFGAKVGVHQLAYLARENLLAKFPNPQFVYITRKDVVMQAVSLNIAWQTGIWTSKVKSDKVPEFDGEGIAGQIRGIVESQSGFEAFFSVHGIEPLRLTYEMIEADLEKSMRRVCRLVGLKRPGQIPLPAMTLKKQRTSRNEEWARRFRDMYVFPEVVPGPLVRTVKRRKKSL
jgi:LPS sulfotransferase NodH